MIFITYLNVIVSILSQFSEKLYLKNLDLTKENIPRESRDKNLGFFLLMNCSKQKIVENKVSYCEKEQEAKDIVDAACRIGCLVEQDGCNCRSQGTSKGLC